MAVNLQDLIDIDLLAYFKSKLDVLFGQKVDKVAGKGLSTNDFTVALKFKLDNCEEYSQANRIESIKIAGTPLSITNKVVNIPVVTNNLPGLMSTEDKSKLDNIVGVPSSGNENNHYILEHYVELDSNTNEYVNGNRWTEPNNYYRFSVVCDPSQPVPGTELIFDQNFNPNEEILYPFRDYHKIPAIDLTMLDPVSDNSALYFIPLLDCNEDPDMTNSTRQGYIAHFGIFENALECIITIKWHWNNLNPTSIIITSNISVVEYASKEFAGSRVKNYSRTVSYYYIGQNIPYIIANGLTPETIYNNLSAGSYTVIYVIDSEGAMGHVSGSIFPFTLRNTFFNTDDLDLSAIYLESSACGEANNQPKEFYSMHYVDNSTGQDPDLPALEMWLIRKTALTNNDQYSSDITRIDASLNLKANAADVYTKTEIDQKLTGALNFKGTKATVAQLPQSGNTTGDVWNITEDGSEWAWTGSDWEELGTTIDLSGYVEDTDIGLATNQDIDNMFTPYVGE